MLVITNAGFLIDWPNSAEVCSREKKIRSKLPLTQVKLFLETKIISIKESFGVPLTPYKEYVEYTLIYDDV